MPHPVHGPPGHGACRARLRCILAQRPAMCHTRALARAWAYAGQEGVRLRDWRPWTRRLALEPGRHLPPQHLPPQRVSALATAARVIVNLLLSLRACLCHCEPDCVIVSS